MKNTWIEFSSKSYFEKNYLPIIETFKNNPPCPESHFGQSWVGKSADEIFRDILKDYPDAVLVSSGEGER